MSSIINSVDRALDVLNYLYEAGRDGVSITKLSEDLGIYKSTIHRTMITLENKDFVSQDPETKKYYLGTKLFIIGMGIGEHMGLKNIIEPLAKKLHKEFNETVNVSILERNSADGYFSVVIHKEENNQVLRFNAEVGSKNDCTCAAVGKCLLAFSEGIDFSVYEKKPMIAYTPKTIVTLKDLQKELEKVRMQGYALDDEEREIGLTCVGAPIFRHQKQVIAAISLSGPTTRMKGPDFEEKIRRIRQTAADISSKLD